MSRFLQQYLEQIEDKSKAQTIEEEERKLDLVDAIWAGDVDRLQEIARCICCCDEHTFEHCPARAWYGCRGQNSMTRDDQESWIRHYEQNHGMTRDEFFGVDEN